MLPDVVEEIDFLRWDAARARAMAALSQVEALKAQLGQAKEAAKRLADVANESTNALWEKYQMAKADSIGPERKIMRVAAQ